MSGSTTPTSLSPLVRALQKHSVTARVSDTDIYRAYGGIQVGTDYIICVESKGSRPFFLSKTFHAFRTLAAQLKKVTRDHQAACMNMPETQQLLTCIEKDIVRRVEHQSVQYLGKLSTSNVKSLNRKRTKIIETVLGAIMANFPVDVNAHPFYVDISGVIEDFFLTDHCEEVEDDAGGDESERSSASWTKKKSKSSGFFKPVTSAASSVTKPIYSAANSVSSAASAVAKHGAHAANSVAKPILHATTSAGEIRPFSRRQRRSVEVREADALELNNVLEVDVADIDTSQNEDGSEEEDDQDVTPKAALLSDSASAQGVNPSQATSPLRPLIDLVEKDPVKATAVAAAFIAVLWVAAMKSVTLRIDFEVVLLVAAFSAGMQMPKSGMTTTAKSVALEPKKKSTMPEKKPKSLRIRPALAVSKEDPMHRLLRQSMIMSPRGDSAASLLGGSLQGDDDVIPEETGDEVDESIEFVEPLPQFPEGAKIGSHLNCWSQPPASLFHVRGAKYLQDKKKVSSGNFVFPTRGMDLYLTDLCPENAASNPGVFGGKLREKPSFIINFRLPWGVLLVYYEIPEHLVPFVRARHENDYEMDSLPSMDDMDPGDRCAARFLLGSDDQRNQTLKIVPMVVQGPWIVKQAVGGKPAIIGTKMPVTYYYQRANEGKKKALYLELDLDIVASSAARGILSMVRSYTQSLTIDLGFVIQGNAPDELPERMLNGARIHGLDPLNAPAYPVSSMETVGGLYDDSGVDGDD